ncbi:heparan-sulfate 6-O-sulfotransferase 1-like [Ctenocephalides felis]|uniref:heparan-sulfate 6-O-sulfotransferase 1-like n=1 Tax=Ctenocephalides felis TaxID=7515 RepID=UPI000E6E4370|nr:heparan-sulfate 6-O-sulfotransferase 1-like [Ctenocephalides felis]
MTRRMVQITQPALMGRYNTVSRPCSCQRNKKRCYCFRPNRKEIWLFSRYSTGWRCGLHADWTELTNCVDQELDRTEGGPARRRYFYVTLLREPVARYLSEYRHVQRGATWKNSRHWCNGRNASIRELPPCYTGPTWHGVDLDSFMACPSNLAANRQTRMLADLSKVGCYNTSAMSKTERDHLMLESAKRNLASMAYFGLTEFFKVAQYVFEETFNMRFAIPFDQHNATVSSAALNSVTSEQARRIHELNSLDIQLYAFAKKLMFQRFEKLKAKDANFEQRFAHLGELANLRSGVTEFDWDNNLEELTTPYKIL